MKKLFFITVLFIAGITGFSQTVRTPAGFILNDRTSYGTIRGQINDAFAALYDTVYYHYGWFMPTVDSVGVLRADINANTASIVAHNLRLVAMELIDHTHANSSILANTTASFTTALSSQISTNQSNIGTLTSDLNTAEADIVTLRQRMDSAVVQILIVGADTALQSGEQETGYIFAIDESLAGYDLVRMKIYHTGRRTNGITSCSVYNGTTSMVASAATLTSSTRVAANIDENEDDVAEGDVLNFKYSDDGPAPTRGLNVMLIFKRP